MAHTVEEPSIKSGRLLLLCVGLLVAAATPAQQAVVPLQLSFSDPGARSMGFGGAFVALADDATAAFANPAGLVQLLKPEVSIEGRNWRHTTPYTEGGRVEGLPSGNGLDDTVGLRTATADYDATGLSFLSFAYPKGNWSLALYRHEYADLEFSGATQGLYSGGTSCCQTRWYDQQWFTDMEIVTYGISAAYRIDDGFNVGLGIVYYDAFMRAQTTEYLWDEDTPESFLAPNSYLPERSVLTETLGFDDTDLALIGGFFWRPSERFSVGGIYRQGAVVEMGSTSIAGEAIDFGVPPGSVLFQFSGLPLELPDIYGLGVAYRHPDGHLTLSIQWDRIEYSDIPSSLALDDQTIDNANELHLGAEYVFLGSTPIIALRLGVWTDPDHQMHATIDDPYTRALLPKGDDDFHYTMGLGIAMERFQIDLAADFADRADTLSVSAIYNF
jgi:long-chain fatty acid transport protein